MWMLLLTISCHTFNSLSLHMWAIYTEVVSTLPDQRKWAQVWVARQSLRSRIACEISWSCSEESTKPAWIFREKRLTYLISWGSSIAVSTELGIVNNVHLNRFRNKSCTPKALIVMPTPTEYSGTEKPHGIGNNETGISQKRRWNGC